MVSACSNALVTVKSKLGKLSVCRPDKETVAKTKARAKAIFVEAFSTTYSDYHKKSKSVETIEQWLRLKAGLSIREWLENTFDAEYADYESGTRQFVYLCNEGGALIGWLSHSSVSEKGEVYLSQCSLEAASRGQHVSKDTFNQVLEGDTIQQLFPGVKEFKLITRKINEFAERLYKGGGFVCDLEIDPKVYGESYDDRYVGYRKKIVYTWQERIESEHHPLLARQFASFRALEAPAIADDRIKNIPIVECNEPFVDVATISHSRIAMMKDCAPSPNGSKLRAAVYESLKKMVGYLDELAPKFGYKPGQVHIRIYEGLRDLSTQGALFEKKLAEIWEANPDLSLEDAAKETSKWISPVKDNIPVHSTGAAVDIRLWNEERSDYLDMGPFGAIWGANPLAPTFSEGITNSQQANRYYMLLAAAKAGLTNYLNEYWHYSLGDRYAAFWEGAFEAKYGSAGY